MSNLMSHNELANFKSSEELVEVEDQYTYVSDYFQCIMESGLKDQSAKRFCRDILSNK